MTTGIALSPAIVSGEPLSAIAYSRAPIFAVPDGRIRFWVLTALTTSVGVKPLASERRGIEIDGNQALFAAVWPGNRDAGDGDQAAAAGS